MADSDEELENLLSSIPVATQGPINIESSQSTAVDAKIDDDNATVRGKVKKKKKKKEKEKTEKGDLTNDHPAHDYPPQNSALVVTPAESVADSAVSVSDSIAQLTKPLSASDSTGEAPHASDKKRKKRKHKNKNGNPTNDNHLDHPANADQVAPREMASDAVPFGDPITSTKKLPPPGFASDVEAMDDSTYFDDEDVIPSSQKPESSASSSSRRRSIIDGKASSSFPSVPSASKSVVVAAEKDKLDGSTDSLDRLLQADSLVVPSKTAKTTEVRRDEREKSTDSLDRLLDVDDVVSVPVPSESFKTRDEDDEQLDKSSESLDKFLEADLPSPKKKKRAKVESKFKSEKVTKRRESAATTESTLVEGEKKSRKSSRSSAKREIRPSSAASTNSIDLFHDAENVSDKATDQTSTLTLPLAGKRLENAATHRHAPKTVKRLEDRRHRLVLFRLPKIMLKTTSKDESKPAKFHVDISLRGADFFSWRGETGGEAEVESVSIGRRPRRKLRPLGGPLKRLKYASLIEVERRARRNAVVERIPPQQIVPPLMLAANTKSFEKSVKIFCGGIGLEEVANRIVNGEEMRRKGNAKAATAIAVDAAGKEGAGGNEVFQSALSSPNEVFHDSQEILTTSTEKDEGEAGLYESSSQESFHHSVDALIQSVVESKEVKTLDDVACDVTHKISSNDLLKLAEKETNYDYDCDVTHKISSNDLLKVAEKETNYEQEMVEEKKRGNSVDSVDEFVNVEDNQVSIITKNPADAKSMRKEERKKRKKEREREKSAIRGISPVDDTKTDDAIISDIADTTGEEETVKEKKKKKKRKKEKEDRVVEIAVETSVSPSENAVKSEDETKVEAPVVESLASSVPDSHQGIGKSDIMDSTEKSSKKIKKKKKEKEKHRVHIPASGEVAKSQQPNESCATHASINVEKSTVTEIVADANVAEKEDCVIEKSIRESVNTDSPEKSAKKSKKKKKEEKHQVHAPALGEAVESQRANESCVTPVATNIEKSTATEIVEDANVAEKEDRVIEKHIGESVNTDSTEKSAKKSKKRKKEEKHRVHAPASGEVAESQQPNESCATPAATNIEESTMTEIMAEANVAEKEDRVVEKSIGESVNTDSPKKSTKKSKIKKKEEKHRVHAPALGEAVESQRANESCATPVATNIEKSTATEIVEDANVAEKEDCVIEKRIRESVNTDSTEKSAKKSKKRKKEEKHAPASGEVAESQWPNETCATPSATNIEKSTVTEIMAEANVAKEKKKKRKKLYYETASLFGEKTVLSGTLDQSLEQSLPPAQQLRQPEPQPPNQSQPSQIPADQPEKKKKKKKRDRAELQNTAIEEPPMKMMRESESSRVVSGLVDSNL